MDTKDNNDKLSKPESKDAFTMKKSGGEEVAPSSPTKGKRKKRESFFLEVLYFLVGDELKMVNVSRSGKTMLLLIVDLILNLAIIIGLVIIIRTFLISPFQVFGPSMCDTFNYFDEKCQNRYGEYLIVNKFGYQNLFGWQVGLPNRGDVIIFHPPQNGTDFFIKRVIGLPSEKVTLKDGHVYISNNKFPDGFKLDEPYLNSRNINSTFPLVKEKTVFEIPENTFFVLGDNRLASSDSRSCFKESQSSTSCSSENSTAFLPLNNIEGKAWIVLWPVEKLSIMARAEYPEFAQ